jgi:hypothetical protein
MACIRCDAERARFTHYITSHATPMQKAWWLAHLRDVKCREHCACKGTRHCTFHEEAPQVEEKNARLSG